MLDGCAVLHARELGSFQGEDWYFPNGGLIFSSRRIDLLSKEGWWDGEENGVRTF